MILQCGLALFPLALLHIIAHSLYKAHAFLSSGTAVEVVAPARRPGPVAVPNLKAVGRAFILALLIYAGIALAFGLDGKSPQAIALGAILILGVAYLLAQGLADVPPSCADLADEPARGPRLGELLRAPADRGSPHGWCPARHALAGTAGMGPRGARHGEFRPRGLRAGNLPLWSDHPAAAGLRVHLANGLTRMRSSIAGSAAGSEAARLTPRPHLPFLSRNGSLR